jgi:hypothetical protein
VVPDEAGQGLGELVVVVGEPVSEELQEFGELGGVGDVEGL